MVEQSALVPNFWRTIVEPEPERFVDSKLDTCNGNEDFGAREAYLTYKT